MDDLLTLLQWPFDGKALGRRRNALRRALLERSGLMDRRIAVLGGSTTHDLVALMELFLLANGIRPMFYESEYNQWWEDAMFGNPALDAMRMLESIRRDLTALDVPGLSVDTESRGKSLFTTIRLESAGSFDMSIRKTDGMFEFFLMSGSASEDDGPVSFRIEFFCE